MKLSVAVFSFIATIVYLPLNDAKPHQVRNHPSLYNFEYEVKDESLSNHFGHTEVSDGRTVAGVYHVAVDDSHTQKVDYNVGGSFSSVVPHWARDSSYQNRGSSTLQSGSKSHVTSYPGKENIFNHQAQRPGQHHDSSPYPTQERKIPSLAQIPKQNSAVVSNSHQGDLRDNHQSPLLRPNTVGSSYPHQENRGRYPEPQTGSQVRYAVTHPGHENKVSYNQEPRPAPHPIAAFNHDQENKDSYHQEPRTAPHPITASYHHQEIKDSYHQETRPAPHPVATSYHHQENKEYYNQEQRPAPQPIAAFNHLQGNKDSHHISGYDRTTEAHLPVTGNREFYQTPQLGPHLTAPSYSRTQVPSQNQKPKAIKLLYFPNESKEPHTGKKPVPKPVAPFNFIPQTKHIHQLSEGATKINKEQIPKNEPEDTLEAKTDSAEQLSGVVTVETLDTESQKTEQISSETKDSVKEEDTIEKAEDSGLTDKVESIPTENKEIQEDSSATEKTEIIETQLNSDVENKNPSEEISSIVEKNEDTKQKITIADSVFEIIDKIHTTNSEKELAQNKDSDLNAKSEPALEQDLTAKEENSNKAKTIWSTEFTKTFQVPATLLKTELVGEVQPPLLFQQKPNVGVQLKTKSEPSFDITTKEEKSKLWLTELTNTFQVPKTEEIRADIKTSHILGGAATTLSKTESIELEPSLSTQQKVNVDIKLNAKSEPAFEQIVTSRKENLEFAETFQDKRSKLLNEENPILSKTEPAEGIVKFDSSLSAKQKQDANQQSIRSEPAGTWFTEFASSFQLPKVEEERTDAVKVSQFSGEEKTTLTKIGSTEVVTKVHSSIPLKEKLDNVSLDAQLEAKSEPVIELLISKKETNPTDTSSKTWSKEFSNTFEIPKTEEVIALGKELHLTDKDKAKLAKGETIELIAKVHLSLNSKQEHAQNFNFGVNAKSEPTFDAKEEISRSNAPKQFWSTEFENTFLIPKTEEDIVFSKDSESDKDSHLNPKTESLVETDLTGKVQAANKQLWVTDFAKTLEVSKTEPVIGSASTKIESIISKSEPASDVVVTAKDEKITSQRKNWLAAFGETFDVEEKKNIPKNDESEKTEEFAAEKVAENNPSNKRENRSRKNRSRKERSRKLTT